MFVVFFGIAIKQDKKNRFKHYNHKLIKTVYSYFSFKEYDKTDL